MTEQMIVALMGAVAVVGASSGFWSYFQNRNKKLSASDLLLMGLAYDKIITLGLSYIERGWITKDEFEELRKYFFDPYKEMGGNGVAEQVMANVAALKMRSFTMTNVVVEEKHAE